MRAILIRGGRPIKTPESSCHCLFVLPITLIALILFASACDRTPQSPSDTHGKGSPALDFSQPASGYGFRIFFPKSVGATIRVFGSGSAEALPSDKDGILSALDREYDYQLTVEWKSVGPTADDEPDALNPAVALRERLSMMAAQGTHFLINPKSEYKDLNGDSTVQSLMLLDNGGKPQKASVAAWYCKASIVPLMKKPTPILSK